MKGLILDEWDHSNPHPHFWSIPNLTLAQIFSFTKLSLFFLLGGGLGGDSKEFLEYFINFDNFFINIRHYIAITLQVAY